MEVIDHLIQWSLTNACLFSVCLCLERDAEPQSPTWGLMTGWRMIAQDVMNDLDGDHEASIRSEGMTAWIT